MQEAYPGMQESYDAYMSGSNMANMMTNMSTFNPLSTSAQTFSEPSSKPQLFINIASGLGPRPSSVTPPATPAQAYTQSATTSGRLSPGYLHSTPTLTLSPNSQFHPSNLLPLPSPIPTRQDTCAWRTYPPHRLAELVGTDVLVECTQHLPMDHRHWALLEQHANAGRVALLSYLLENCLKHEDPTKLQSRHQNAVHKLGAYLHQLIRQKSRLLQSRPDIMAMLETLYATCPGVAVHMDGRILQLLSEHLQGPHDVAACQQFLMARAADGLGSVDQLDTPAALQRDLKCYIEHAAWVSSLLT